MIIDKMLFFGAVFMIYFLKLSAGKGFWRNLRETDNALRTVAIDYQKCYLKYQKAELDLQFLYRCKNNGIFPKFIRYKHIKDKHKRIRTKYYSRFLKEAIDEKHNRKRELNKELSVKLDILKGRTTWMKMMIIKFSIHRLASYKSENIKLIHDKKFDTLLFDKRMQDGLSNNPNTLINNLAGFELTDDEVEILKYGLKHGIAIRPKESEMIVIAEDIWHQMEARNAYNDKFSSKQRLKTLLQAFTYNYLDIDDKQFGVDSKKLKILNGLKQKCVVLKPDKSQGIVLISKEAYVSSLSNIFNDSLKFKCINEDPTISRIHNIQCYLRTMLIRKEITEPEKKAMWPKAAQLGRGYGLPKTHKQFEQIPPFRPIIDTTSTPYYGIGKFLSNFLRPLTINDHIVSDTFQAVERIRNIPPEIFSSGYKYVSFDVESLFTSVPLKKTIEIILKKIYTEKVISTTIKKRTLKKLLLDCCTKNAFSFNNKLYEQTDGVSMGSSLGPVMANIIMAELEREIIEPLIEDGTLKFYTRYVDDTLVLMKHNDIQKVLNKLNSYHKNLKFTVDKFEDDNVHFLDLRIMDNKTDVYCKDTHSGQYTHFDSYTPWSLKTSWVRALYTRAEKICSDDTLFSKQVSKISKYLSWNGFPRHVRNSILHRLKRKTSRVTTDETKTDTVEIHFRIPYAGIKGEQLIKSCVRRMKRFVKRNVKFVIMYDTKKLSFFCNTKDRVPGLQRHNLVYKITCPGCGRNYVGKTDVCLETRLKQHGSKSDQPMYQHFMQCEHFIELFKFYNNGYALDSVDQNSHGDVTDVPSAEFMVNATLTNYEIVDFNKNWSQLLFLEAYYIKQLDPSLNRGLKASRDLALFAL